MNYTAVFKKSGQLIWGHKALWVVGLLLMSGILPNLALSHFYLRGFLSLQLQIINSSSANIEGLLAPVVDLVQNPALLIGSAIVSFLVFTIIWIISVIGEAALIRAVNDFEEGRSPSLREMLSAGTALLARFIAIDTVIFFPLFLIFLIQLLAVGGGLIGAILFLLQPGATPEDLIPIGIGVGLLVLFLTVLSVPVAIITVLLRLVAFRSAVVEDLPTRPSIRRAWELIKTRIGEILVTFLLLYAVNYAVGIVTSIVVAPFSIGSALLFITPIMQGGLSQQGNINSFLIVMSFVSLISVLPTLLYRVFSSVVWTMVYREWQRDA